MVRLVSLMHSSLLLSFPCRYGSEIPPCLWHQQVSHHSIRLVFVFPLSLLPSFFLLKLFLQEVTLTASLRILKFQRSARGVGMCDLLSGFFSSHNTLINLTSITWVFFIEHYYFRSQPSPFSGAQPFKVAFLLGFNLISVFCRFTRSWMCSPSYFPVPIISLSRCVWLGWLARWDCLPEWLPVYLPPVCAIRPLSLISLLIVDWLSNWLISWLFSWLTD